MNYHIFSEDERSVSAVNSLCKQLFNWYFIQLNNNHEVCMNTTDYHPVSTKCKTGFYAHSVYFLPLSDAKLKYQESFCWNCKFQFSEEEWLHTYCRTVYCNSILFTVRQFRTVLRIHTFMMNK